MVSKVRRVPSIKVFAKPPEFPWLSQVKCRDVHVQCGLVKVGACLVKSSVYINNRQSIAGSLSNVLLRFDFA
jgi:hypothetical protein